MKVSSFRKIQVSKSFKFQEKSSFRKIQVSKSFKFDFVELKVQKNVVSLLNHPVAQLLSHITRHSGKADELLNQTGTFGDVVHHFGQ